jgi:hypothetical protein
MLRMTLPLLLPLEWPIQHPSAIFYLLLLVIGPLAVGAVIALIGLAPAWRRSLDRSASAAEVVRRDI